MITIKQNTAIDILIGAFLDESDGKTAENGLSIAYTDVKLSKNGGALASKHEATAPVNDSLGYYTCSLDTTDTNTPGLLRLAVHVAGALPVFEDLYILQENESPSVPADATPGSSRSLSGIVLQVAKILGGVKEGLATSGSTTTLTDIKRRLEPAETWDRGFIIMLSGANVGKMRTVTSYAEGVFTFDALTGAIIGGDRYAVVPYLFSKEDIVSAINTALLDFGDYLQHDETLTTDSDAQIYTLPDNVLNVKKFETAQSEDSPYDYKEQYYWDENSGYIYFKAGKEPGTGDMKIRLWYIGTHPELVDDDDGIDTEIDDRWLKWAASVNLYRSYYSQYGEADPHKVQLMNEAVQNEAMERIRVQGRVTRNMARTPRLGS